MDYTALKNEITLDPAGRGYSGMTDEEIANDLNSITETKPVRSVMSSQVLEAIVPSEYSVLPQTDKDLLHAMLSMGVLDPYGPNTTLVFQNMFGPATTTRANLVALRETPVSRAENLGLGPVTPGDVFRAMNGGY